MSKTLVVLSKEDWTANDEQGCTRDELKLGCLQRIAAATEVMAQSYQRLIDERDSYKRWHDAEVVKVDHLNRRINSLRGVIIKLKGKK